MHSEMGPVRQNPIQRKKKETGQKYNVRICTQGGHNK